MNNLMYKFVLAVSLVLSFQVSAQITSNDCILKQFEEKIAITESPLGKQFVRTLSTDFKNGNLNVYIGGIANSMIDTPTSAGQYIGETRRFTRMWGETGAIFLRDVGSGPRLQKTDDVLDAFVHEYGHHLFGNSEARTTSFQQNLRDALGLSVSEHREDYINEMNFKSNQMEMKRRKGLTGSSPPSNGPFKAMEELGGGSGRVVGGNVSGGSGRGLGRAIKNIGSNVGEAIIDSATNPQNIKSLGISIAVDVGVHIGGGAVGLSEGQTDLASALGGMGAAGYAGGPMGVIVGGVATAGWSVGEIGYHSGVAVYNDGLGGYWGSVSSGSGNTYWDNFKKAYTWW